MGEDYLQPECDRYMRPGSNNGLTQFVEEADQALYQAKIAWRNRIACFTPKEREGISGDQT
ncbi:MAG: hypothetical protein VKN60_08990 [Cyanobacteriota bacterium]|nr:hypothetical protein [Cyanobacteriota bacterium]